jgi:hypothetical protein
VRSIVLDIGRLGETIPFTPLDIEAGLARTWRTVSQLDVGQLPKPLPPRSPMATA